MSQNNEANYEVSTETFIHNVISVMKKYVPELSQEKFGQFLKMSIDDMKLELNTIRYVSLEDYNLCSESVQDQLSQKHFYPAHFYEGGDLLSLWENECYEPYMEDDEEEEDEARESYLAFIDLIDKKYIRVNGHGVEIEFGADNPAEEHPDWSNWC